MVSAFKTPPTPFLVYGYKTSFRSLPHLHKGGRKYYCWITFTVPPEPN